MILSIGVDLIHDPSKLIPLFLWNAIQPGKEIPPECLASLVREDHVTGRLIAPNVDLVALEPELRWETNGLAPAILEQFGDPDVAHGDLLERPCDEIELQAPYPF